MNTPTPRLWLTLMTSAGNEENLRELCDPILRYLDGIVAVVHRPCDGDPGLAYLQSVKGAGKIIVRDWVQRHDFSQNETLYAGVIQEGDLVLTCDTLERPAAPFVASIKTEMAREMDQQGWDCIYYYGKAYLFRYREEMHYRGSPHWGLVGVQNGFELAQVIPDEGRVRLNVRPIKRPDPLGWVLHYAKYHLYPAGSNHCALGLDHWPPGDRNLQFIERETRRLAFRRLMRARGFPLTLDGLKQLLTGALDSQLRHHLTAEKVLSDAWHYWNGDRSQLRDSHNPAHALPVP